MCLLGTLGTQTVPEHLDIVLIGKMNTLTFQEEIGNDPVGTIHTAPELGSPGTALEHNWSIGVRR